MRKLFPRDLVVPRKREGILGGLYWLLYLLGPTAVLLLLLQFTGIDAEDPEVLLFINLCCFAVNFAAIMAIFWDFLCRSFAPIKKFGWFMLAIAISYGIYYALSLPISMAYGFFQLSPENLNQDAVSAMMLQEPLLMGLCTVIFAPVTEECLCRGLIFGPLCRKCPWLAYVVSSIVFALLHVLGAIGVSTPLDLILSFLMYIPAGLALGFAYQRTRSIWASILLHAFINLLSFAATYLLQFLA